MTDFTVAGYRTVRTWRTFEVVSGDVIEEKTKRIFIKLRCLEKDFQLMEILI